VARWARDAEKWRSKSWRDRPVEIGRIAADWKQIWRLGGFAGQGLEFVGGRVSRKGAKDRKARQEKRKEEKREEKRRVEIRTVGLRND